MARMRNRVAAVTGVVHGTDEELPPSQDGARTVRLGITVSSCWGDPVFSGASKGVCTVDGRDSDGLPEGRS